MTAQSKISAVHKNVFAALAAAQTEMETVRKGSVNPHFKSRYADLADVLSAVLPALNRNGMALFHTIVLDGGERVMRTILAHGDSGTQIECDVPLIVQKNDMQGMKSATTYAKRIGAESVTGIAPEDDDGNAAAAAAPRQQSKPAPKPAEKPANDAAEKATEYLSEADTLDDLAERWKSLPNSTRALPAVQASKDAKKAALQRPENADLDYDNVPF